MNFISKRNFYFNSLSKKLFFFSLFMLFFIIGFFIHININTHFTFESYQTVFADIDDNADRGKSGFVKNPGDTSSSSISLTSRVPEQPLVFITLSQIPYTGFKAGLPLTVLYWFILLLWSSALAYILLVRKFGTGIFVTAKVGIGNRFQFSQKLSVKTKEPEETFQPIHQPPQTKPAFNLTAKATDTLILQTERNGVKSPWLELKRSTTGRTGNVESKEILQIEKNTVPTQTITRTVAQVIEVKRETNTQTLTKLISSIVLADTDRVLEVLQTYKSNTKSISEILVQSLCEIDKLYCRRLGEDEQLSDERVEDIFEDWSNEDLQKLIQKLSLGIGQNHLSQETSAKVAFLRALEFSQEVKERK